MERTVDIQTGESVAFRYELAGLGSRFLAVSIDLLIQMSILIGLFVAVGLLADALPAHGHATLSAAQKIGRSIGQALIVVVIFMLFIGYFIVFEWLWNGRTPGKRLVGIRVVRDGGFPVDFASSVVRNIVRMLEFGLGFYLFSAISALLSPLNRRLGDIAAGTLVVRDKAYERTVPTFREFVGSDPAVIELSPAETDLIRKYVARRADFAPGVRVKLAARIAEPLRPRLRANFGHLDDDTLLVHLFHTALR